MFVQEKLCAEDGINGHRLGGKRGVHVARFSLDKLPLRIFHPSVKPSLSLAWLPGNLADRVKHFGADIIHLNWTNSGFVSIESLKTFHTPIVWTLHDMWAFSGGCLYAGDCERYKATCGQCPQLESRHDQDLSKWVWKRKEKAWRDLRLTLVTPSRWLADCVRQSSLLNKFRVEVIPNGLDLQIYKPQDKVAARQRLGLPLGKKLILFGAMMATSDRRKGFHLLRDALEILKLGGWGGRCEAVVFGSSGGGGDEYGLNTHFLGVLNDEQSIVDAYSAADVFVAPSVQENLANTVMEALACGTPCVAFAIGGMPDMIDSGRNGFLAVPNEPGDLAKGIISLIENGPLLQEASGRAREKVVNNFEISMIVQKYQALYEEVVNK
jgi:glycosyltransferase involved in cell wall biosynthesis